jgi:hypothetical protein
MPVADDDLLEDQRVQHGGEGRDDDEHHEDGQVAAVSRGELDDAPLTSPADQGRALAWLNARDNGRR